MPHGYMWPGLVLVSLRSKDADYTHCSTHVVALALQALMALHMHTIALFPAPTQFLISFIVSTIM